MGRRAKCIFHVPVWRSRMLSRILSPALAVVFVGLLGSPIISCAESPQASADTISRVLAELMAGPPPSSIESMKQSLFAGVGDSNFASLSERARPEDRDLLKL